MWLYPDDSQILELSTKCPPAEAFDAAESAGVPRRTRRRPRRRAGDEDEEGARVLLEAAQEDRLRTLRVIEFPHSTASCSRRAIPDEDREGGFRHGGWQRPYFDDVLASSAAKGMAATDAYLFGRKTYEKMAAFWPNAPADDPYGSTSTHAEVRRVEDARVGRVGALRAHPGRRRGRGGEAQGTGGRKHRRPRERRARADPDGARPRRRVLPGRCSRSCSAAGSGSSGTRKMR